MKSLFYHLIGMLALAAVALNASAAALGNEGAHGGDEVAIEFTAAANQALSNLDEKNRPAYLDLKKSGIENTIKNAKIFVTDSLLTVPAENRLFIVVARNYPDLGKIEIDRTRWNAIQYSHVKEALALHEILSLLRKESSGVYTISGAYLAMFGNSAENLNAMALGIPDYHCEFSYLVAGQGNQITSFDVTEPYTENPPNGGTPIFYPRFKKITVNVPERKGVHFQVTVTETGMRIQGFGTAQVSDGNATYENGFPIGDAVIPRKDGATPSNALRELFLFTPDTTVNGIANEDYYGVPVKIAIYGDLRTSLSCGPMSQK